MQRQPQTHPQNTGSLAYQIGTGYFSEFCFSSYYYFSFCVVLLSLSLLGAFEYTDLLLPSKRIGLQTGIRSLFSINYIYINTVPIIGLGLLGPG